MKLYVVWMIISLMDGTEHKTMWGRVQGDGNCIAFEYELNQFTSSFLDVRYECDLKYPVRQD